MKFNVKKEIIIVSAILLSALLISSIVYFTMPVEISPATMSWEYKKKEAYNRLLATPIILYHNIDGKGAYSIRLEDLRAHFQMLKDQDISVISLSGLMSRLENPVKFDKKSVVISFDDGYSSMYTKLLPLAKEFGYPVTLFVYVNAVSENGKMTWEMLRKLDREGVDIQCHSISHEDLERLSGKNTPESREKMFSELYVSKQIFELYMNKKMKFFAFPYGRYDLKVVEASKNAGYLRVFSTDYGSNLITNNNFCLRRHHIKSNFTLDYVKKIIQ
jgi:peptidoglycan/xylan/chitin deacetylase (PgdA/CDA1 family)